MITFSDQFSQVVIMPFLPALCEMFFPEANDVGFYVGLIQSLFYLVQFFAAPYWGEKSDKIGRRPIFIVGLLGIIISMLLLGFVQSYGIACLSRMVAAGLCVTPVIAKPYIGEIVHHSIIHKAFAVIGVAVGVAAFIAPLFGGFLAEPADHYNSFNNDFWTSFPYLLPCLASIIFAALSLIYVIKYIPETSLFLKENKKKKKHIKNI